MLSSLNSRYLNDLLVALVFLASLANATFSQEKAPRITSDPPRFAGPTETGYLLPNGWHITPVGKQIETNDLILNILPLQDGKHALATSNGFNEHQLLLLDLERGEIVDKQTAYQSWYGLSYSPQRNRIWWSGGGWGKLHTFDLVDHKLSRVGDAEPNAQQLSREQLTALRAELEKEKGFRSGLILDEERNVLYSLKINSGKLAAISLENGEARELELGGRPYDIVLNQSRHLLYVTDWARSRLVIVDPVEMRVVGRIAVGEHPNQIAKHPTDSRLFISCGSTNGVSVVDTVRGIVTETIYTGLFPKAPEGSTPDAVAISPDGNTLAVANADNNCIALVDIEHPNRSAVQGFIPTGWYPTAVAFTPDGKKLLVGVGKGNQSKANPIPKPSDEDKNASETEKEIRKIIPFPYIGTVMTGAVSVVEMPDEERLKQYTEQVYKNCPYSDSILTSVPHDKPTAIPTKVGDPSPIKYVIYIIKENRTYDQVFGDLAEGANPKGNGDPSLCMFPRNVTPNHHKLAEQFVLLDNMYCNGQVSRDGHPWSTMAYNTDYIARDWHLTYSRRLGVDDDDEGHLASAPSGYIWDACLRAGISYRSYKEYGARVSEGTDVRMEGRVPGLIGHMCPNFGTGRSSTGRERDADLVDIFLEEYRDFTAKNTMPRFIIMSLGEDHTDGTRPGSFTPQACVGSNDLALGKLVDAVSHGPLWKETAIFVIEDDAQNGPDHVDAHRTVSLVISPYTKRQFVDSTQYSTVSMIRTMELILGLQPLSQYDASARPMFNSFTNVADLSPYDLVPAQIDLMAKNDAAAYGAKRSLEMDFEEYDRIDDFELNEILWRAIKGVDAPLPPAVRRAIAFRANRTDAERRNP